MRSRILIFLILPPLLIVALPGSAKAGKENVPGNTLWERFFDRRDAFTPSLRVGLEYDDNIHLTLRDEERGSWKYILEPGLEFDLPGEQTSLLFQYFPTIFIYQERDDRFDVNHTALISAEHRFDRRNKIRFSNLFSRKEDPRDISRVIVPGQREADHYSNALAVRYSHRPTRRTVWGINYEKERRAYDSDVMKRYFNRTVNQVGGLFHYRFSRRLRFDGGYLFGRAKYDQSDNDYRLHLVRGGFDWIINRRLTANLFAGYTHHRSDSGGKVTGPYIESFIEATAGPDLSFEVKYLHKIQDFPEGHQPSHLGHTLEASATYRPLPKLRVGLDYLGRLSYFRSSRNEADDRDTGSDLFWQSDLYAAYRFNPVTNLKLGWRRTENNSTQPDSPYFRNQVYLEITASF